MLNNVPAKVRDALSKVMDAKQTMAATQRQSEEKAKQIADITTEQTRIRENMGKLAQNSELYHRYIKKLDQQETELEDLRRKIETLKDTEARQQRELNDYLSGLEID